MPTRYLARSPMPVSAQELFDWHARPGAFERLSPPFAPAQVLEHTGGIQKGARVVLKMKTGPISQKWVAVHTDYQDGDHFTDTQESGPFASFVQVHRMVPDGTHASFLEDDVSYEVPLGGLGEAFGGAFVEHKLQSLFAYRHALMAADLSRHQAYAGHPRLHVLITGASGLLGSALVPFLTTGGHRVTVRRHQQLADPLPDDVDAVIHLAGESISGRWTRERKAEIARSREEGTRAIASAITRAARKPAVFISGSAVGYYGDRGEEVLTEGSSPGADFLASVCTRWEAETGPVEDAGVRVVKLRTGVVLSPAGGALSQLLPAVKAGLAGPVGKGTQYLPWVSLEDWVGATHFALMEEKLRGPLNVVAPQERTNAQLLHALGEVLHRPTVVPLPTLAVKAAFGEMGVALLLASQRVRPAALEAAGFSFLHPELVPALRFVLGVNRLENAAPARTTAR